MVILMHRIPLQEAVLSAKHDALRHSEPGTPPPESSPSIVYDASLPRCFFGCRRTKIQQPLCAQWNMPERRSCSSRRVLAAVLIPQRDISMVSLPEDSLGA